MKIINDYKRSMIAEEGFEPPSLPSNIAPALLPIAATTALQPFGNTLLGHLPKEVF